MKRKRKERLERPSKRRKIELPVIDLTEDSDDEESSIIKDPSNSISNEKKEEKNEPCPICLEKIKQRGFLDCCEHKFCYKCIKEWSNKMNTCPVCRRRFNEILVYSKERKRKVKSKKRGERKRVKRVRVPDRIPSMPSTSSFVPPVLDRRQFFSATVFSGISIPNLFLNAFLQSGSSRFFLHHDPEEEESSIDGTEENPVVIDGEDDDNEIEIIPSNNNNNNTTLDIMERRRRRRRRRRRATTRTSESSRRRRRRETIRNREEIVSSVVPSSTNNNSHEEEDVQVIDLT